MVDEQGWSGFERKPDVDGAALGAVTGAAGDFDTTPNFQVDGRYCGLIDFGEIRGTEPLFDLGHFLLHDQESTPSPLIDDLLAGYGEEAALPPGREELVRRSAVLLDHPDDPSGSAGSRLDRRATQREQARSVWSRPDRPRASGS